MRISFDLDDTLICYRPGVPREWDRLRWWLRPWVREPLRLGAIDLLRELSAAGHDVGVYTTSHRNPRLVRWWLWWHGVRVGWVINQHHHERHFGRLGRSKHPRHFSIDLHVDDSCGVWIENRGEAHVCVVLPTDSNWTDRVRDAVARVARREPPAPPTDLPPEYAHLI